MNLPMPSPNSVRSPEVMPPISKGNPELDTTRSYGVDPLTLQLLPKAWQELTGQDRPLPPELLRQPKPRIDLFDRGIAEVEETDDGSIGVGINTGLMKWLNGDRHTTTSTVEQGPERGKEYRGLYLDGGIYRLPGFVVAISSLMINNVSDGEYSPRAYRRHGYRPQRSESKDIVDIYYAEPTTDAGDSTLAQASSVFGLPYLCKQISDRTSAGNDGVANSDGALEYVSDTDPVVPGYDIQIRNSLPEMAQLLPSEPGYRTIQNTEVRVDEEGARVRSYVFDKFLGVSPERKEHHFGTTGRVLTWFTLRGPEDNKPAPIVFAPSVVFAEDYLEPKK